MISVLVPAYNEEKLLGSCLESLAVQNPLPDEIVIVDNASTDRTPEIIKEFIANHPELNVTAVYETKKGAPAAREAGWRAAHGDVIVMTDADETFPFAWTATLHPPLSPTPS